MDIRFKIKHKHKKYETVIQVKTKKYFPMILTFSYICIKKIMILRSTDEPFRVYGHDIEGRKEKKNCTDIDTKGDVSKVKYLYFISKIF